MARPHVGQTGRGGVRAGTLWGGASRGNPLKISEVTPLVMGTEWRNLTIVKVRTDEGLVGVGEVRMVNHTQALLGYLEHAIPNHVLGADPFDIEALVQRMWRTDF